ncbi:uncharacterized protein LOC111716612 [Eurytemora carolleeae]|uniref:uncharacterized protein LOC111716612 n=1 Tax=Eurytemora carolleeae TaxID=1294199 RepID=UPI000C768971|nr:uncharacterized protein LOC111716612 [Eurytemora carolleeae]XP_023347851.1 uncharacterized protein LOC111716612 [Eurytemora carolleeae]|eukprot:XP_023347850.1 uncharacterized protein LOC111716612 [Eurytemora affinis]
MNSDIEKCFLVCKPGYVPRLYRGTYCEQHGQVFSWNRSIAELECILATNLVTIGGYYQEYMFYTFGLNSNIHSICRTEKFYRTTAQFFRGKIIASGGNKQDTTKQLFEYESVSSGLQPLTKALKYGGDYVSSAVVHDRYYVTGSWNQVEYLQENGEATVSSGELVNSENLFHCSVRYLDKYYMVISSESTKVYDIVSGSTTNLPSLPIPRYVFGCGTFLNKSSGEELILVSGGFNETSNLKSPTTDCQVFTPSLGTWSTISPMNIARSSHKLVTTIDGVFAVGGEKNETLELMNITTLTWKTVSPYFVARFGVGAVAIPAHIV